MAEFATKGVADTALGLAVAGTTLGLLNNGLGGIFGGVLGQGNRGCNEDHFVNRYEAGQASRIAELETEIKLRDSNIYTDGKILDLYKYFDGELQRVKGEICAQAVLNQRTADSFEAVRNDVTCVKNELYGAINRERDERCCADNAIITYVNGTFYPKLVANIEPGTETTAQFLYNPLPSCGCGCNR